MLPSQSQKARGNRRKLFAPPDGSIKFFINRVENLMRVRAPDTAERALERSHKMRERSEPHLVHLLQTMLQVQGA
jgi:hypothetical protein